MRSIYERALGAEFAKLHPEVKKRFGFSSRDRIASIGIGVMEEIWRGPFFTWPFLVLGAWRNIMFPDRGRNVPFRLENYAYKDRFGRETVTWLRTFYFPRKVRRFDATMVYSEKRGSIVDYLGTHQHLAVDIFLSVSEKGGMKLRSGGQRFYEGPIGFSFPMLFSGYAEVHEWFDDASGLFRIEVAVRNTVWGKLFGYRGSFEVEYVPVDTVPEDVKPLREERRE